MFANTALMVECRLPVVPLVVAKDRYFPVHEIQMLLSIDLVGTPLAFHAITGCDSVSQFSGHVKNKPGRYSSNITLI